METVKFRKELGICGIDLPESVAKAEKLAEEKQAQNQS